MEEEKKPEEVVFDPTKKKKKKKKEIEPVAELAAEVEKVEIPDAPEDTADGDGLDLKKKKKKKKKAVTEDEGEGEAAAVEEMEQVGGEAEAPKKKKKKKKTDTAEEEGGEGEGEKKKKKKKKKDGGSAEGALPWDGDEARDYLYEELLQRVTDTIRAKNPELAGEKRRFLIKPPQVVREGTKRTLFVNFAEICKMMHRNPDHVYAYLLAELGTSGSIDGSQRMVIKGKFQPSAIEKVLRGYVTEYLNCNSCKSPDSILRRDNRLFFLSCNQCGAERSVPPIKSGYVAQVGKRKKV